MAALRVRRDLLPPSFPEEINDGKLADAAKWMKGPADQDPWYSNLSECACAELRITHIQRLKRPSPFERTPFKLLDG